MKSLLQTKQWADLRQSYGWQAHWIEDILVLEKPLPFGKSFLYVPEPDFGSIDFKVFMPKVAQIAKNSQSIFLRIDFINKKDEAIEKSLKKFKFIKAFEEIQPEDRQIIDISQSENEILAQMKPKGRYNIKIAEKNGVEVAESGNISIFYDIFCQTAKRNGFSIRPLKYFQDLYDILAASDNVKLLIASYNEKPIAAEIVTFYGQTASYLYGASLDDFRNVMAPYLMHWEAIKLAKEKGCKYYDLLAVAPQGEIRNSPLGMNFEIRKLMEKYAGITRFKEQFGGEHVKLLGSWDFVYKPIWYAGFKIAEKLRRA